MSLLEAIILGIVQGLTEFIPVSSSGHLVVVPALLGWAEPGLAFDTMLHMGTLLALVVYFRHDWWALLRGGLGSLARRKVSTPEARLAWFIVIGCIPAALAGVLLQSWFAAMFSQPGQVGYFLLGTAALLALGEVAGRRQRELEKLNLLDTLVIGLMQAVAILPGISRSGSTMAAGLLLGLKRPAAARFSFLLAAPIILGAGLTQMLGMLKLGGTSGQVGVLAVGFLVSAVVGYLAIDFLLRYLRTRTLYPFAAYCFAAGLLIIVLLGRV